MIVTKEELYARAYVVCGCNATEAARQAGYKCPGKVGYRIRRRPRVQARIEQLLHRRGLSLSRVLDETDPARALTVLRMGCHPSNPTSVRIRAAVELGKMTGLYDLDRRERRKPNPYASMSQPELDAELELAYATMAERRRRGGYVVPERSAEAPVPRG